MVGEIFLVTTDACDTSESVIDVFRISSKSSDSSDSSNPSESSESSESSEASESSESSKASASVGRLSSYFGKTPLESFWKTEEGFEVLGLLMRIFFPVRAFHPLLHLLRHL